MSSRTLVSACLFIVTLATPAAAGYGWWGSGTPDAAVKLWTTPQGTVARSGTSIWVSRDRARTWTERRLRLSSGAEPLVAAWAVDSSSADRLFAATTDPENGVLWGSIDGGRTLQRRDSGLRGERLASVEVDPHDGSRLFASSTSGLYLSQDAGLQWRRVDLPAESGGVGSVEFDPTRPGTMYGVGSTPVRSRDGGHTWQPLSVGTNLYYASLAVDAERPDILYFAYSDIYRVNSTVLRSLDGGDTFVELEDGLPPYLFVRQVLVRQSTPLLVAGGNVYGLGRDDRWSRVTDVPVAETVWAMVVDADDRGRTYVASNRGVFAEALRGDEAQDTDTDGLPDVWESRYGLSLLDPADAAADFDEDGRTSLEGYRSPVDFRHPRGFRRVAFAEGIANAAFQTRYAIFNPGQRAATVVVRFVLESGRVVQRELDLAAERRVIIEAESIPELIGRTFGVEFASDEYIAAERTVQWSNGQGAHREVAQVPSRDWYFAEGATHSGFNVFYALSNQGDQPVQVWLRPLVYTSANASGDPLDVIRPLRLPFEIAPHSRVTIWLNQAFSAWYPSDDLGAHIAASAPIVAERIMYLSTPTTVFGAGHASAGTSRAATRWSLVEGATGAFFDEYVLMANPFEVPSTATLTFRRADGVTATKAYVVPPFGRVTIWVDEEQPDARGALFRDAAVSIDVEASQPIVVERSMWWPGPTSATWGEAHVSAAMSDGHAAWLVPDAFVGGDHNADTYLLIANVSSMRSLIVVEVGNGRSDEGVRWHPRAFSLEPGARLSVSLRDLWALAAPSERRELMARVTALHANGLPGSVVVERSTYSDAGGQRWRAGSSAPGIPLP